MKNGWHHMIYTHKVRMVSVDIFGAFDCPDVGQMNPNRTHSATLVQSLGLFNSPFANQQAAFFTERPQVEIGDDPDAQMQRTVALAFSQTPLPAEQDRRHACARTRLGAVEQVCRTLIKLIQASLPSSNAH